MLPWLLSGAAFLLAFVAYGRARRTARQLEELSRWYWELRYQYGELKARVGQFDSVPPAEPLEPPASREVFIPLSSVKR